MTSVLHIRSLLPGPYTVGQSVPCDVNGETVDAVLVSQSYRRGCFMEIWRLPDGVEFSTIRYVARLSFSELEAEE